MVGMARGLYYPGMALRLIISVLIAQSVLAWPLDATQPDDRSMDIRERAIRVRSIDPTLEDDDFADLMPLKEAIGDARVVWLGEQSHGEGAAFLAKGRLVRFLHDEMGFDVIVWEAGLASGPLVDEAMRNSHLTAFEAAEKSVFPIWSQSAQVRPTLDYIKESQLTNSPITSAGMDAQLTGMRGGRALERLVEDLYAPTESMPTGVLGFESSMKIFWMTQTIESADALIDNLQFTLGLIESDTELLESHHEAWRIEFVERSIGDAVSFIRTRREIIANNGNATAVDPELLNARDRRMGDNLVFLANEVYPDRKLIVWAATFHGVYNLSKVSYKLQPDLYNTMYAAGITAHRELGDDLYHVAFVAEGGSVQNVFGAGKGALPPKPAGSYEHLLGDIEHPFLFQDLRGLPAKHWLRSETVMAPLGNEPMTAVWPEQFDAVFSIETEFPASRTELHPEGAILTVEHSP
jgi:erythromycin esterase